jgi:hypothetical protein
MGKKDKKNKAREKMLKNIKQDVRHIPPAYAQSPPPPPPPQRWMSAWQRVVDMACTSLVGG